MGLQFLSEAMLWGLLAASLPVIIHLLIKRPPRKLVFPPISFLRSKALKRAAGKKLKRLLLLLLRAMVPVCLALIAARGIFAPSAGGDDSPPAVVILLDNSPSMLYEISGGTLLRKGLEIGRDIIRRSPDGAVFAVASFRNCSTFSATPETALNLLETAAFATSGNSFISAWNDVLERLAEIEDERPKELFFISDFASRNFTNFQVPELPPNTSVMLMDIGKDISLDRAILSVKPISPIIGKGLPVMLRAMVSSTTDLDKQVLELFMNGKKVLTKSVTLRGGVPADIEMEFIPDISGSAVITGELRLASHDSFRLNDTAYFSLEATPRVKILVAYDGSDAGKTAQSFLLSNAIAPEVLGNSAPYLVETKQLVSVEAGQIEKFSAIYLLTSKPPKKELKEALKVWLNAGGALFSFASTEMDMKEFSGWNGLPVIKAPFKYLEEPVALSGISPKNALVDFFKSGGNGRIDGVFSLARFDIKAIPPFSRLLLEYEDSVPAALLFPSGRGISFFFNISLEDSESNLTRRVAFLPLIHETLRISSPAASLKRDFILGKAAVEVTGAKNARYAEIITAGGKRKPAVYDPELGIAFPKEPLSSGAYVMVFVRDGVVEKRAFSVNLPQDESDLGRLQDEELLALFPNAELKSGGLGSRNALFTSIGLNTVLIPLLLFFFLFELWIANTFYRAAKSSPDEDAPDELEENDAS